MKTITNDHVSRKELIQFGCGLALLGGLAGGLLLWNGHRTGMLAIIAGLLLAVAFWLDMPGIRRCYAGWMKFAGVMSHFMTRILLTILYLSVLSPIALLGRACGQRFVERRFRADCNSYWETRTWPDRLSSEKQS